LHASGPNKLQKCCFRDKASYLQGRDTTRQPLVERAVLIVACRWRESFR